jgi:hypothetical protein
VGFFDIAGPVQRQQPVEDAGSPFHVGITIMNRLRLKTGVSSFLRGAKSSRDRALFRSTVREGTALAKADR